MWLARRLATARAAGAATLGQHAVTALDWFALVRHLARLLATGRAAHPLGAAIVRLGGPSVGGSSGDPTVRLLEASRLAPRRSWVRAAAWMLRGWPDRFVASTATAGLWSSDLLRDIDAPPTIFRDTVLTHRNARARRGGTRGARGGTTTGHRRPDPVTAWAHALAAG